MSGRAGAGHVSVDLGGAIYIVSNRAWEHYLRLLAEEGDASAAVDGPGWKCVATDPMRITDWDAARAREELAGVA